jgi:hypothetical protein
MKKYLTIEEDDDSYKVWLMSDRRETAEDWIKEHGKVDYAYRIIEIDTTKSIRVVRELKEVQTDGYA